MLADPTGKLAKDFDVMIDADGLAERGSFIINPAGKIVAYEVIAGNVGRNAEELLRRVQASQFVAKYGDQVCPAKWKPGAATLKPGIDLVGKI
jgi:peroxiredoxin (alkyl hydroperoxide reductase subunit C)